MLVSTATIWLLLACTLAATGGPAGELRIERVFGPEVPTGDYKHPASIAELANGDLYLAYYGGKGEYAPGTGVFGARLARGSHKWSAPRLIAQDPFRSVGNGVIWQAPDSIVWLFYVVRYGETWSTSRIQAKISRDGAHTWTDSFVIASDEGDMVRGAPIVLANGDYLLPIYNETGHDPEVVGAESTSRFLRLEQGKHAWSASGVIHSAKGNIQPSVVELSPTRLVAYCRRGGGYTPVTDGYIVRAESTDGGHTWSEGKDTQLPNPNSAIQLLRLRNGHLVLIYNDSMNDRTPLTVALSEDGENWKYRKNLAVGDFDYAYPFAFQAHDGKVHVVYTSHSRTVINHAVFDEEWVKKR
jgi:predicted neuraminidase